MEVFFNTLSEEKKKIVKQIFVDYYWISEEMIKHSKDVDWKKHIYNRLLKLNFTPNQIYDLGQVGLPKVDAFKQKLLQFNPEVIVETHNVFFTSQEHRDLLEDFVFIAVDSLSARKDIVQGLESHLLVDYAIESRMGFEHAEINIIDPAFSTQIESYLSTLKTDEEVTESACNARIITTLTCIIASSIVHTICGLAAQERHEKVYSPASKQIFSLPSDINNSLSTFTLGEKI